MKHIGGPPYNHTAKAVFSKLMRKKQQYPRDNEL
ncbi:hypothetical protein T11_8032 [Trichinella zimbabwensis]|uniref:Uncharacterized protein n=1 Tax=Trichinella zimbabwensis TaxID=268475 RepID=A0A0V1G4Y9_9BILA|nr:hypothetical protein T11_8032 [Trichinella zimbabwensis]